VPRSSITFGTIGLAFLIYITMKGSLRNYLQVVGVL